MEGETSCLRSALAASIRDDEARASAALRTNASGTFKIALAEASGRSAAITIAMTDVREHDRYYAATSVRSGHIHNGRPTATRSCSIDHPEALLLWIIRRHRRITTVVESYLLHRESFAENTEYRRRRCAAEASRTRAEKDSQKPTGGCLRFTRILHRAPLDALIYSASHLGILGIARRPIVSRTANWAKGISFCRAGCCRQQHIDCVEVNNQCSAACRSCRP
jgi:hypothetical protein